MGPMIDGDVESASVVIPKTILHTKMDGTVVTEEVWEALDEPIPKPTAVENRPNTSPFIYEPLENPSPPPESQNTQRVTI